MSAAITLVNENITILVQAENLISDLNDTLYTNDKVPPYQSGVGKHIRHVLDFYRALLKPPEDVIDYDDRDRSEAVETHRQQAVAAIRQTIEDLEFLKNADLHVMSKNDDGGHRHHDQEYSRSSMGRELQFLASHTVHHFAMIAFILVQQGYTPPQDFGVAASTLIHWQKVGRPGQKSS